MDEKPTDAVRTKPDSSLVVACRAVREGKAQAVVSAGNTGAMLAACLLEIRRLAGVRRPAIAVTIPSRDGVSVLLDSGANADARPEDLLQFAHMGRCSPRRSSTCRIRRSGSSPSARSRRRATS
jgi:glycerol-3-phosphate acyltransferase PlsX